ncbi:MAG: HAD domain-containing protein [Planctomycetaceae bacterium]|nr:hypothetical protein [Planctomycetaceae bacterium]
MNQRVVICDVDGVLLPWDQWRMDGLRLLLQKTGAKVVLSSTWRQSKKLMGQLRKAFEENGVDPAAIVDSTPSLPNALRSEEIKTWIRSHPEVLRVVIINDVQINDPELLPFFVKTEPLVGLDEKAAQKAAVILLGDEHAVKNDHDLITRTSGYKKGVQHESEDQARTYRPPSILP